MALLEAIFTELRRKPQLVEVHPNSQKSFKKSEKTPPPSKFIADSSAISTMLRTLRENGTSREGAGQLPALLVDQGQLPN